MRIRIIVPVITTLFVLLFGLAPVFAQSKPDRPVVTISETILDKYFLRTGRMLYKNPVSQTDINVSFPNGLYLDLWGSTGLNGKENFGREVDGTVGWTNPHVDFGVSYYKFIPLDKISSSLVDLYAEVRHTLKFGDHTLIPYAKADGIIPITDAGRNSGFIGSLGARHVWQLNQTFGVSQSIEVLYQTPIFRSDSGLAGQYNGAFDINLSKSVTLSPIVLKVAAPLTHMHGRKFSKAFGMRVTVTFR